jgi:hypothetical protein
MLEVCRETYGIYLSTVHENLQTGWDIVIHGAQGQWWSVVTDIASGCAGWAAEALGELTSP